MMVTLIGSKNRLAHRMCHERHLIIVIITNFGIVISPQKQGVSVFKLKKKNVPLCYTTVIAMPQRLTKKH